MMPIYWRISPNENEMECAKRKTRLKINKNKKKPKVKQLQNNFDGSELSSVIHTENGNWICGCNCYAANAILLMIGLIEQSMMR